MNAQNGGNPAEIVKVAAIQMASGPYVSPNLSEAARLIELAVKQGAKLVVLPEYFAIMGFKDTDKVDAKEAEGKGPIQDFLKKQQKNIKFGLLVAPYP